MSFYLLFLALGLTAALALLVEETVHEESGWTLIPLLLFAFSGISWVADFGPSQGVKVLSCVSLGTFSAAYRRRSFRDGVRGAGLGLLFCGLGLSAARWSGLGEAFFQLSWTFAFGAAAVGIPLAYAVSLALAAWIFFHPWYSGKRRNGAYRLLVSWILATGAVEWDLRLRRGYGPASLADAVGLRDQPPMIMARADLGSGKPVLFTSETLVVEKLRVSPDDLESLRHYLLRFKTRSVFARQAMDSLRRGQLLTWDPDRALDVLTVADRVYFPDYRQALSLLRAGPMTPARLERLNELALFALSDRRGFESVTESQYIFEAFSAAYAHFSDSEQSRYWLGKVWRLWPVYEKKVEIVPVDPEVRGEISGTLRAENGPSSDLQAALFSVSAGTATYHDGANLCCSSVPDAAGRFSFTSLGVGRYQLSLRGAAKRIGSLVKRSPGIIELTSERPRVELGMLGILSSPEPVAKK